MKRARSVWSLDWTVEIMRKHTVFPLYFFFLFNSFSNPIVGCGPVRGVADRMLTRVERPRGGEWLGICRKAIDHASMMYFGNISVTPRDCCHGSPQ